MTDNLIFIIDRSASIQSYAEPYLDTINGIIQAQKHVNPNTLLTCAIFNECIHYLCINLPLNKLVHSMNINDLRPLGLTAFYDNVSVIVRNLLDFYRNNSQKAPIVIILTDGEDTCSKLVTAKQTALQIAMAKAEGWQFIYLGVNENSMRIGRELGCNACILYSCSIKGFARIPDIMAKLLSDRNVPIVDIDISDITESLTNVKIN